MRTMIAVLLIGAAATAFDFYSEPEELQPCRPFTTIYQLTENDIEQMGQLWLAANHLPIDGKVVVYTPDTSYHSYERDKKPYRIKIAVKKPCSDESKP